MQGKTLTFKYFLLNEQNVNLGHKVGTVLTSVQDLEQDIGGMGMRQIARIADDIVNQLRKILHSEWSPRQAKYLKDLQKLAVVLKKAIEEKDDLKEMIPQLSQELQKISEKLGVKTNTLNAPEAPDSPPMPPEMQLTGNGPQPKQQGQPQSPPPQNQPPMPQ